MLLRVALILLIAQCLLIPFRLQAVQALDVEQYHVELKPDLINKTVEGHESIDFSVDRTVKEVVFDCGSLQVSEVKGEDVKSFRQEKNQLTIVLKDNCKSKEHNVEIFYKGSPAKGLVFLPEAPAAYTVFHTSEWMIGNLSPEDKAILWLTLSIPDTLSCKANGILMETSQDMKQHVTSYMWCSGSAVPMYTYGFVIGKFYSTEKLYNGIMLRSHSAYYDEAQLQYIFKDTPDMLSFFTEKSGMPYYNLEYNQFLLGNHYQEMSGLCVLKKAYGDMRYRDSTEINMISHELAHQWWGNMITCKNWNHIWLNEAFATYMSAAYNEHRFGKAKYEQDIESYRNVYEKIKNEGGDKPLVFPNWSNPSASDRNLVYFKGAYVLHLLRQELGDERFWKALSAYSRQYYGKSVTTEDFQRSFEKSAGTNLDDFFNRWVYYIQ